MGLSRRQFTKEFKRVLFRSSEGRPGLIVLSVLQRLSGAGQEETDGSHENEGIVLPAHRQQCQRAFTDAGRERRRIGE